MKKIITAIGNENLNRKLKEEENIKIIGTDIQYEEGIFELLEKEKNIDFLILSEKITSEINLIKLIEKIKIINKNIKIILILENKKEEIENILIAKGIYKIIYHNRIEIKDLINIINQNEEYQEKEELKKEIEDLKKLIIESKQINNEIKYKKENKRNKSKNILRENKFIKKFYSKIKKQFTKIIPNYNSTKNKLNSEKLNQKEIISISGPSGVGKSIIAVNIAKSLIYKHEKILIIDFDVLNNSLHTILGVKKYPQSVEKQIKNNTNVNVENFIIKVNKKIDLISITNLLFEIKGKLNFEKIERIINKLKENYDIIIIDTSSECFFDITKNIIQLSNKNIFVTETNILEIKKAKELLNIYINEWKINKDKFNILFNKYDKDCINMNLLKSIFCEFNIIGTLKYNTKYNELINKNRKNNFHDRKIREEYLKINNNI